MLLFMTYIFKFGRWFAKKKKVQRITKPLSRNCESEYWRECQRSLTSSLLAVSHSVKFRKLSMTRYNPTALSTRSLCSSALRNAFHFR